MDSPHWGTITPMCTDHAQRENDGWGGICHPEREKLDRRLTGETNTYRSAWLTPGSVHASPPLALTAGEGTDHPGFLPGEPRGQRLVGYTDPGVAELDTTERLNTQSWWQSKGKVSSPCSALSSRCGLDVLGLGSKPSPDSSTYGHATTHPQATSTWGNL